MPHADFIHLRVHSAYSLSAGAIKVKQLVTLCKESKMPAVAITDTGNLFGALEFAQACIDAGIQPIIGCELALRRAEPEGRGLRPGAVPEPDRLLMLVQSEAGYRNLSALVSKAFLETPSGETPQVELALLAAAGEGLLCLTGGPEGPVGRLLRDGQNEAAEAMLLRLAEIFPGRLYVELMRHGVAVEDQIEGASVDLAFRHGIPLVATNDCFFPDPG